MLDRVILTGFMCSGKSSVGRILARRLAWDFVDFDERIERREGRSIAEIFRDSGEAYFRELESALTDEVADRRHVVLAPGGGWVTEPACVERLRPRSLMVWLRIRAETVHARHEAQSRVVRPLLQGDDPKPAIVSILKAREPLYAQADLWLDTDGRAPDELAGAIEAEMRRRLLDAVDRTPRG